MHQITTYNALVGYYLQEARVALGIDQSDLARLTGISQPVLSRLEKGKASISADQLFVICKALEVRPSQLLQQVENGLAAIEKEENIDVLTSKETSSGGSLLAGAAIGAVLALLLTR